MWFENFVRCDLKLMFVTIPMYFSTIAKIIRCCDKLWFLGVSIVTRRDLQRSIVICLYLAMYWRSWLYTLQTYLCTDSVRRNKKKDGFLFSEAHSFHNNRVKITSTDKSSDYLPMHSWPSLPIFWSIAIFFSLSPIIFVAPFRVFCEKLSFAWKSLSWKKFKSKSLSQQKFKSNWFVNP